MADIEIYMTAVCPFCIRAKRLLDKKGVDYSERCVDQNPGFWEEIEDRCGRDTVPQLFIGDHHVGGFDDMVELDFDGELDQLLGLVTEG